MTPGDGFADGYSTAWHRGIVPDAGSGFGKFGAQTMSFSGEFQGRGIL